MAFDTAGNIYVVTEETLQIQKYSASGVLLAEWGGATTYNGSALNGPSAIAVSSTGGVYVTDLFNHRVVKFSPDGAYQSTFGTLDSEGDGGSVLDGGQFQSPVAIVVDRDDNVYVLDYDTGFVQKFTPGQAWSSQWGGPALYGTANVAISEPHGLTISPGATQYIYVADRGNDRCLKFATNGSFQAGYDWGSSGTLDGQFTGPFSIAVDSSGTIYVSDRNPLNEYGDRIQKFDGSMSPVTWLATWGGRSETEAGAIAGPFGICFDSTGRLLVVDIVSLATSSWRTSEMRACRSSMRRATSSRSSVSPEQEAARSAGPSPWRWTRTATSQ